jgi:hypothetical protein
MPEIIYHREDGSLLPSSSGSTDSVAIDTNTARHNTHAEVVTMPSVNTKGNNIKHVDLRKRSQSNTRLTAKNKDITPSIHNTNNTKKLTEVDNTIVKYARSQQYSIVQKITLGVILSIAIFMLAGAFIAPNFTHDVIIKTAIYAGFNTDSANTGSNSFLRAVANMISSESSYVKSI